MVRKLTQELKFSLVDQTKMITAASELSRNTVVYGGGGEMRWEVVTRRRAHAACGCTSRTRVPAFPTSQLALTDGWTSGSGLGLGLSGSKRLVNEFDIRTARRRRHLRDDHALEVIGVHAASRFPISDASQVGEARRARGCGWPPMRASTRRAAAGWRIVVTELGNNLVRHAQRRAAAARRCRPDGRREVEVLVDRPRPRHGRRRRAACATATRPAARRAPGSAPCSAWPTDFSCILACRRGHGDRRRRVARSAAAAPAPAGSALQRRRGVAGRARRGGLRRRLGVRARRRRVRRVMVADGLGHGPEAAEASPTRPWPSSTPQPVAAPRAPAASASTPRCAAPAAPRSPWRTLDADAGTVRVRRRRQHRRAGSSPASTTARCCRSTAPPACRCARSQDVAYPWPAHALLVLHSDGIATRWNLAGRRRPAAAAIPAVIAAWLIRDHSRGRDDATVVVMRAELTDGR